MIPGRDLDLLSLGYVRANINSRLQAQMAMSGQPVQTSEELIELGRSKEMCMWKSELESVVAYHAAAADPWQIPDRRHRTGEP